MMRVATLLLMFSAVAIAPAQLIVTGDKPDTTLCGSERVAPNFDNRTVRDVSGHVTDVFGAALKDFPLQLRLGTSKKPFRMFNTDANGRFLLTSIPPGRYRLILMSRKWLQLTALLCASDASAGCDLRVQALNPPNDLRSSSKYSKCPPR